jgi:predicted ATPase
VPILSGHEDQDAQGQGETTITELIQTDPPKYSLILIDEIESSLHPRAQRRLIRDLANVARERELQIMLTTHSPYILEELPEKARMQIFWSDEDRKVMTGVSAQFAMSKNGRCSASRLRNLC